jgi:hypothetical protein
MNLRDVFNSRRFTSITEGPGYSRHQEGWWG